MKVKVGFILIIIFISTLPIASALDLVPPFFLDSAQVLPSGIRNPRFSNVYVASDTRFGGGGQFEPLGAPLNRVIHWTDVLDAQKTATEKSIVLSTIKDTGLDVNGGPGNSTGAVNVVANVQVPVLAIGLSERLTLAVAVPVMNISVSADSGFSRSAEGQKWVEHVSNLSVDDGNNAARQLNNAVNEKVSRLGYQPIQSKSISNIGDIQVIGKYVVHQDPLNLWSLKTTLVLPTGIAPNSNAALDIPTGDGRVQIGETVLYDRILAPDLRWNAFGGILALLSNQMDRRIPISDTDSLSSDQETLTRETGAVASLGTSVSYFFPALGIMTGAGYHFQFQTQTHFSGGTLYSSQRYAELDALFPSQTLHSVVVMAGFSTIEWFKNKKFFYPLQANLVYSHPIFGRNVAASDVFTGEIVLFF